MLDETKKIVDNIFKKESNLIYGLLCKVSNRYSDDAVFEVLNFDKNISCIETENTKWNNFIYSNSYIKLNKCVENLQKFIKLKNVEDYRVEVFEDLKEYLIEIVKIHLLSIKFSKFKINNMKLNNIVKILERKNIDRELIEAIDSFINLYNKAQYEYIDLDLDESIDRKNIIGVYLSFKRLEEILLKKSEKRKNITEVEENENILKKKRLYNSCNELYKKGEYLLEINNSPFCGQFILKKDGADIYKSKIYKKCRLENPIFESNYLLITLQHDIKEFNLVIFDIENEKIYEKYVPIIDKSLRDREKIMKVNINEKNIIIYTKNSSFSYPKKQFFLDESHFEKLLTKMIEKFDLNSKEKIFFISSLLIIICFILFCLFGIRIIFGIMGIMFLFYLSVFIYIKKNSKYNEIFNINNYKQVLLISLLLPVIMIILGFFVISASAFILSVIIFGVNLTSFWASKSEYIFLSLWSIMFYFVSRYFFSSILNIFSGIVGGKLTLINKEKIIIINRIYFYVIYICFYIAIVGKADISVFIEYLKSFSKYIYEGQWHIERTVLLGLLKESMVVVAIVDSLEELVKKYFSKNEIKN